jgi:hypothetical protein
MNTLQHDLGALKSAHGQVINHHHYLHVPNLNNGMKALLLNGLKERQSPDLHIGADTA